MTKNKYARATTNRIFNIWRDMIRRCELPKRTNYKYYGGKGIKVCNEWHDFKTFVDWAFSNGYKDNLTIERINNNGNYEPKNCTWKSIKEQCKNRSSNKNVTANGETHTIMEWAKILNMNPCTLYNRKRSGWEDSKIVSKEKHINQYY